MSSDGRCPSLLRLARELEERVAHLGATGWSAGRLEALLERAELRAWRIEVLSGAGLAGARCLLDGTQALIAWSRPPQGDLGIGGVLVARSLPVGPGRWLLLGRPALVADPAGFERLVASLRAPRGEFWRVHGGVLARAARVRVGAGQPAGERRAA